MEFLILDKDFAELGRIDDFASLQWTRKYYDVGKYQLNLSSEYFMLFDQAEYLFRPDTQELAFVDDIQSQVNSRGNRTLKVSGKLIEDMLNDRVIDVESNYNDTAENIAKQLVQKYFVITAGRIVPTIEIGDIPTLSEPVSRQYKGDEVGTAIYELLQEKELSQRLRFDYLQNKLIYEVWQGLDRRQDQSENEWAIFSDNNETITEISYEKDRSDYRNYCYVVGDTITVAVDQTEGATRRKELYYSSGMSRKNDDGSTMTEAQYREKLKQAGLEKLASKKISEVFDGTVNTETMRYRVEYDLGDLCTCFVQELGKMADKRIVEVKEVYEDGNIEITPVFGEEGVTITSLIRKAGLR